jgi:hypothetical protein
MLRFSPVLYDVRFLKLVRTGLNSSTRSVTLSAIKGNQDYFGSSCTSMSVHTCWIYRPILPNVNEHLVILCSCILIVCFTTVLSVLVCREVIMFRHRSGGNYYC